VTVPQDNMKWRKSSRSQDQGACVELSPLGAVRDSKNPEAPHLEVSLSGLLAAVKAGRLTR
jgi:hypothetical protein